MLQTPITDPITIFATCLIVFLTVPLVFERMRIPGIVGLVLTGALIGPNGLNLLQRDSTIDLLSRVGLLYIFFMSALEIDLHEFGRNRTRSMVFGLFSFWIPQIAGAILAVVLLDFSIVTAILLASMFGSHTLLAYPVAARLGITRTPIVTMAVGGTIVADTIAIVVLAVVAASQRGEVGWTFWLTLLPSILVYGAAIFTLVPMLARYFFRRVRGGSVIEFAFIMAVVYTCACLAPLVHLEPIIGAFLAGFSLNRFVPHSGPLMSRVEFIGSSLFIPFFLFATGMLVDVRVLMGDPSAWGVVIFMVVMVTLTKYLGAWATRRLYNLSRDEEMVLFGLSVPQAAATLAAVYVGLQIGLFNDAVLNGAIMMIIVTCVIGPIVVQRHGLKVAQADAHTTTPSTRALQRILVPLSNPQTAGELTQLALLLRDPREEQPLFPVAVASDETGVVRAEKLLLSALVSASEADVKAEPLTRIDLNPASGIVRAAQEIRATDLVIGWNGSLSPGAAIFGSVIDQVLENTAQQVLVARLQYPIVTAKRLVLVLGSSTAYQLGFRYALQSIRRIGNELGAPVHILAVSEGGAEVGRSISRSGTDLKHTLQVVESWQHLEGCLSSETGSEDLLVIISSRSGLGGQNKITSGLPRLLVQLERSFLVLYPSTGPTGFSAPNADLPGHLSPENILFDPAPGDFPTLVRTMIACRYPEGSQEWSTVSQALLQDEFALLMLHESGLVMAHARIPFVQEPSLYLAFRPGGFSHPQSERKSTVLALLVFPSGFSPQEHLELLAQTAQLFAEKEHVAKLAEVTNHDDLVQWIRQARQLKPRPRIHTVEETNPE